MVAASVTHAQAPAPSDAQTRTDVPTFRSGISIVEVSAVVTGDGDKPITDLTAADFEVLEDGQRRPVVSARFLAPRASAPRPAPPAFIGDARLDEVATNRDLADAPAFVLLLDDLNVAALDSYRAIRAALGVLETIPADALVSVVNTSGTGGGLLTLTRPNQDHSERVKAFRGQYVIVGPSHGISSSWDAPCSDGASPDCVDPTRAGRRAGALRAVGDLFSRTGSRRKVLFWFVTDMGVSPLDPKGNQAAQFAGLQRLLGGDVTVYAIDPRENVAPNDGNPVYNARRTGGRYRVGPADATFMGQGGSAMVLDADDMVAVPLSQLTRETGGRWVQNANNVEKIGAEIVRQNLSSYVLAYESAASETDGRHTIEVKVRRRGARISARRAFHVLPESANAAVARSDDDVTERLREVIMGGVPSGTLALQAHVAPQLTGEGPARALVTVQVDEETTDAESVDVLLLAADDMGATAAVQRLTMRRPPAGRLWEGSVTLELPRGPYQLRVAAATPDGMQSGLLLHAFDMRPPSGALVLGVPTLLGEDETGVRPTLARAFPSGHPLAFQVELGGSAVAAGKATMQARLLDAQGREVRVQPLTTEADGAATSHLRATGLVSTEALVPGAYTLVIEARANADARPVAHAIPVTLEEAIPAVASAPAARQAALRPLPVAHGPLARDAAVGPRAIRAEPEWEAFWAALPTKQPVPDIDFSRVTLLAIVLDETHDRAGAPEITRVETEPGGVVVHWRVAPGAPAPTSIAERRPFVVMGVVGQQGHVRFARADR
ncbi:MAG: VWA domain-containing protein [Acidobacteria bacterium]|nr:VWA domain-containing protein [Acidobacteriota bacterium]